VLYPDVFINRQTNACNCVWLLINTSRYLCFDSFSFVVMVSCVLFYQSSVFFGVSDLDHNDLENRSRSCLRVYVSACLCFCVFMCLRVSQS